MFTIIIIDNQGHYRELRGVLREGVRFQRIVSWLCYWHTRWTTEPRAWSTEPMPPMAQTVDTTPYPAA